MLEVIPVTVDIDKIRVICKHLKVWIWCTVKKYRAQDWSVSDSSLHKNGNVYNMQGEADHPCNNMATPIHRPRSLQENNFLIRETPQNGNLGGRGVGFGKFSYVKVGHATPNSKGHCTLTIFVKRVLNYCHSYVDIIGSTNKS